MKADYDHMELRNPDEPVVPIVAAEEYLIAVAWGRGRIYDPE
ncbi:hypothetical protein [Tibeticola sp.]|nr:hypothetical protein [Tibeticola sp.]